MNKKSAPGAGRSCLLPWKYRGIIAVFIAFSVLLLLLPVSAQTGETDVLEKQLEQTPESRKSVLLNRLSKAALDAPRGPGQAEKALEYARDALLYAGKYRQPDQEVYALANTGWAYIRLNNFQEARTFILKAVTAAEKRKNLKEQCYSLYALSVLYSHIPDYSRTVEVLKRLEILYARLGDKKKLAHTALAISNLSGIVGRRGDEIDYLRKTLTLYRELKDKPMTVTTLERMGNYYAGIGDNAEALKFYLDAVKTGETFGTDKQTYWAYLSYAEFLVEQKNYPEADAAVDRAIAISENPGKPVSPKEAFYWKAVILKKRKQFDNALQYMNRALALQMGETISPYTNPVTFLMEIGRIYFEKKEYPTAVANYQKALAYAIQVKNSREQAMCYHLIGQVRLAEKIFGHARSNLEKSLEIAQTIDDPLLIKENFKLLSHLNAALENYKKAYEYYRLYSGLKDKIYDEKSARSIAEMKTRYETEKKEREIELLKRNRQVRELTLSRQRLAIIVTVAGLVLVALVMVYFGKKYHYLLTFWKKKHYIGNYKVMDKIASGGMAVVYKAHDIRDKSRTFAVKVLKEELFQDQTQKMRFKHEASIIDQFNHPNIVKISERGQSGGHLYIVMELIDGKTLSGVIAEKEQLPVETVLDIMFQVFDALVKIHEKNIIHRDLKPDNMMLTETPGKGYTVKLLDFGLAKTRAFSRLTRTGMVLGTLHYLSPEQVMDTGVSTASDIYAMGVIGWEMLTGGKPFDGDNEAAVIAKIMENKPPPLSVSRTGVPEPLNELLKRMIDKEPTKRPDAREIFHTLGILKQ